MLRRACLEYFPGASHLNNNIIIINNLFMNKVSLPGSHIFRENLVIKSQIWVFANCPNWGFYIHTQELCACVYFNFQNSLHKITVKQ